MEQPSHNLLTRQRLRPRLRPYTVTTVNLTTQFRRRRYVISSDQPPVEGDFHLPEKYRWQPLEPRW